MRRAKGEDGSLIKATATGQRAQCPSCGKLVIAKCGGTVVNHWAHEVDSECSASWEPETPWHRMIKDALGTIEDQEVAFVDPVTKRVLHRADVFDGRAVAEVQWSRISLEEANERTAFYLNMGFPVLWVLNIALTKLAPLLAHGGAYVVISEGGAYCDYVRGPDEDVAAYLNRRLPFSPTVRDVFSIIRHPSVYTSRA